MSVAAFVYPGLIGKMPVAPGGLPENSRADVGDAQGFHFLPRQLGLRGGIAVGKRTDREPALRGSALPKIIAVVVSQLDLSAEEFDFVDLAPDVLAAPLAVAEE